MIDSGGWTANVTGELQQTFIILPLRWHPEVLRVLPIRHYSHICVERCQLVTIPRNHRLPSAVCGLSYIQYTFIGKQTVGKSPPINTNKCSVIMKK
jgi:hypothetical protein